jgi:hypothetical protein
LGADRPTKIAVIGATGFDHSSPEARVECFSWNRIRKVSNLADYDTVVLDLLSLDYTERLDSAAFREVLDVRIAHKVLTKSPSAIFVLGDPRFTIEAEPEGHRRYGQPFLAWTGIEFIWDDRPGDTVERGWDARDGRPFEAFADKLAHWDYSLAGCRPYPDEYAKVWNVKALQQEGAELAVAVEKICTNSYGNALVFSVAHGVRRIPDDYYARQVSRKQLEALSNPIYFLPESELSEEETLEFVLRDLCGVDVSAPEPEWVREFVAPGQEKVDRELVEVKNHIAELIEEHDRKVEERDEVREPLKLLYETGAALEEAVWDVLEALGAEVERPEDRTKEDGWITVRVGDENFEGVLEIKGIRGRYFDWGGLRQLNDWIERGMSFRKKRYFGIFVGNSTIEDPPRSRIWPFNKNWVEQAEMRGYAGIRSEDLYVIYLLDRTDRLDRDEFWRGLFSTKGPFEMRLYREKLTAEEQEQLVNIPQT